MASFRLEGLDALINEVNRLAQPEHIKNVVRTNGAMLDRTMKSNAVFRMGYATGETQRSISLDMTDGGFSAEVGPHTDYSPYLEYGTRYMASQPFVKKSLDQVAPNFKSDLEKLIDKG